ncbi:MAG: MlaD family protein [candidate division Zixibacteria bacterium]
MARHNNIEFRVGVIILLGLIILTSSLYWLQGYKLERNSTLIQVLFSDVGTLAVGDRVTVSGVHKGKVDQLTLGQGGVVVDLLIYQDVELKRDATFRIRNLGVMGDRYIAIHPGTESGLFDPTKMTFGIYDTGIPEVMGALGEMVIELRSLVFSLRETVASDASLERFNRTVRSLEETSAELAQFMKRNSGKFDDVADNLVAASREVHSLVTRNSSLLDSSITRMERSSVSMETFAHRLDTLSQATRRMATAIDQGEGTLHLLLEDRRLYDDLRQTADNLDDLIQDIRANPRKYINLKLELF